MNILVGFYQVGGVGAVQVETPLTGDGKADHAALLEAVKKLHPKATDITRTGSAIESRELEKALIEYREGAVIKGLFETEDTQEECALRIGVTVFNGEPCVITLRYNRGANSLGINLTERSTKSTIRFTDVIPAMRLVKDLRDLVSSIIGPGGKQTQLNLVEIGPAR